MGKCDAEGWCPPSPQMGACDPTMSQDISPVELLWDRRLETPSKFVGEGGAHSLNSQELPQYVNMAGMFYYA